MSIYYFNYVSLFRLVTFQIMKTRLMHFLRLASNSMNRFSIQGFVNIKRKHQTATPTQLETKLILPVNNPSLSEVATFFQTEIVKFKKNISRHRDKNNNLD